MTQQLITGNDRAQLLQALARQIEPSLPELRAQWRSQEELGFVVADTLSQAVTQIEQLLQADGRGHQVRGRMDSGRLGMRSWPVMDMSPIAASTVCPRSDFGVRNGHPNQAHLPRVD